MYSLCKIRPLYSNYPNAQNQLGARIALFSTFRYSTWLSFALAVLPSLEYCTPIIFHPDLHTAKMFVNDCIYVNGCDYRLAGLSHPYPVSNRYTRLCRLRHGKYGARKLLGIYQISEPWQETEDLCRGYVRSRQSFSNDYQMQPLSDRIFVVSNLLFITLSVERPTPPWNSACYR